MHFLKASIFTAAIFLSPLLWAQTPMPAPTDEPPEESASGVSPAAETRSSLNVEAVTEKKSWSLSFSNLSLATAPQLNYSNNKNKSFESYSDLGYDHKFSAHQTLGVHQYFTVVHDGAKNQNLSTIDDTAITYLHSDVKGILHSEKLAPEVRYYLPTSETSRSKKALGLLRLDLETIWVLNPRWSVSYYINPRQTLIPTSEKHFSTSTLYQYAYGYFTPADRYSYYVFLGRVDAWQSASLKRQEEGDMTGVGASITVIQDHMTLNPEVSIASYKMTEGQKAPAEKWIQEKNVTYYLTSTVTF